MSLHVSIGSTNPLLRGEWVALTFLVCTNICSHNNRAGGKYFVFWSDLKPIIRLAVGFNSKVTRTSSLREMIIHPFPSHLVLQLHHSPHILILSRLLSSASLCTWYNCIFFQSLEGNVWLLWDGSSCAVIPLLACLFLIIFNANSIVRHSSRETKIDMAVHTDRHVYPNYRDKRNFPTTLTSSKKYFWFSTFPFLWLWT